MTDEQSKPKPVRKARQPSYQSVTGAIGRMPPDDLVALAANLAKERPLAALILASELRKSGVEVK